MGGYPGSNRELTVPHTVALPIELYPPYLAILTTFGRQAGKVKVLLAGEA